MNRQRGQITLYIALGAAALIVGLGIAVKVQSSRLNSAKSDLVAAQAQVAQWQGAAKLCSDSVETAQKAAQEANRKAQAALKKARAASASAEAQKRALDDSRGKGLTCGAAVEKVRKGLK